jgi:hypothetical protein
MKKIFKLAILSVVGLSLLSSCCKLGYKKQCSSNCHKTQAEENKAPVVAQPEEKAPAKKTKKVKKVKKVETAPAQATNPENKTN